MLADDHAKLAEWKAALQRLVDAEDRLRTADTSQTAAAEAEVEAALMAYENINAELG
jgi:hypothetical protein